MSVDSAYGLRLSVHYATSSANAASSTGVNAHKTNSIEENSINSDEFEANSTSTSSSPARNHHYYNSGSQHSNRILIDYQHPSNVSIISSSSHYTTTSSASSSVPGDRRPPSLSVYKPKSKPKSSSAIDTSTPVARVNKNKLRQIHRPKSLFQLDNGNAFMPSPVPIPQAAALNNSISTSTLTPEDDPVSSQEQPSYDLTVTEADLRAIDTCYRGHETKVFVCTSLANLYKSRVLPPFAPPDASSEWQLIFTGIPVLVQDTGIARSRVRKRIQLLLVEKGSCFTLWKDVLTHSSSYTCEDDIFHTLKPSADPTSKVGLSFDSAEAAQKFHSCLEMLIEDPAYGAVYGSTGLSRKQRKQLEQDEKLLRKNRLKARRPSKQEISQPCGFQHVVSVSLADAKKYFSMQTFVDTQTRAHKTLDRSFSNSSTHLQPQHPRPRGTPNNSADLDLDRSMARLSLFNSCNELRC